LGYKLPLKPNVNTDADIANGIPHYVQAEKSTPS